MSMALKEIDAETPPWPGLDMQWLAHEQLGATLGAALKVIVPPGKGYPVHLSLDSERVVFLLEGAGVHSGAGGDIDLASDDVLVLKPGEWHGFENGGSGPATLWIFYSPALGFDPDDYEEAGSDSSVTSGRPIKNNVREGRDDPAITHEGNGFVDLKVIWDGAAGSEGVTLGLATFQPDGRHKWHRHERGDEVIYIASGVSHHITPDGDLPMPAGSYAFSPTREWHTMSPDTLVECYFAYLGGASLEEVGYERRPDQAVG